MAVDVLRPQTYWISAQVDTPPDSCPSLLQHCSRPQCCSEQWHFTLLHRGPARPLPLSTEHTAHGPARWSLVTGQPLTHPTAFTCLRNALLPWWSLVKDQPCTELLRAVGLHPLKWSHCTEADSKTYINITGQRNGVWPPACVTSRSGRTSWPGDPRPNPQGAGADRPYLLLSKRERATNSTLRRETCEDKHRAAVRGCGT